MYAGTNTVDSLDSCKTLTRTSHWIRILILKNHSAKESVFSLGSLRGFFTVCYFACLSVWLTDILSDSRELTSVWFVCSVSWWVCLPVDRNSITHLWLIPTTTVAIWKCTPEQFISRQKWNSLPCNQIFTSQFQSAGHLCPVKMLNWWLGQHVLLFTPHWAARLIWFLTIHRAN